MTFEIGVTENGKRRVDARVEAQSDEEVRTLAVNYQTSLASKALRDGQTKAPVVDVRPSRTKSTIRVGGGA